MLSRRAPQVPWESASSWSGGDAMGMFHIDIRDNGVALVTFDHPDKSVNTLSLEALDEFQRHVEPLLDDPGVVALVLASAKHDSFIAGADLDILSRVETAEDASELSRAGNELLEKVASAEKPVVAAIHGAALGGGLEVALACHFLLASHHPATVLGLPEVQLGLLPGGGGTQRLVERVGILQALPMLLTGKRIRARRAKKMGLVDALTTPGGIAETGAMAALALAEGRLKRPKRRRGLVDRLAMVPPLRTLVLRKAGQEVQRQTRGNYPAPEAILECVTTGLRKGRAEGLARESDLFGGLVTSPQSRSLVWLFHAMNRAKEPWPEAERQEVRRLAVLGAGFMGSGVASVSLGLCPVVLRDLSPTVLAEAAGRLSQGLQKRIRSESLTRRDAHRHWSRLRLTTDKDALRGADLVIEAVFEDLDLKRRVLAETEEQIAPDAVFATNTSAIPVSQIAAGARHPQRILGMHYFSPVPKMPLLEIVTTRLTSARATATAHAFGRAQGKTCIVVKDGPGFYTTRILAPYLNEAVFLVQEGARIHDVDQALCNFGFPVGPLALIDEVGIDVGAHVAQDLGQAFAHRGAEPSDALPRLQEAGYLGRKNRKGFYLYPRGKGKKRPNPRIQELLEATRREAIPASEIQDRIALLMVNEATRCLEEEIIRSPDDGDLGAVLGLGFPPFRGGPFRFIDSEGPGRLVDRLQRLADRHGARFQPSDLLRKMAQKGPRFHR